MEKVDVSIVISILSLIISAIIGYLAYFRKGRLYFSIPPKIGIRSYGNEIILCFPFVVTNSGVLSRVINRLLIDIIPIDNNAIKKVVFDACFQWEHFPPGSDEIYEAISPIVVPARDNVKIPIGFISRENGEILPLRPYEFVLYASIKKRIFKKDRIKEILRFKFEGSYIPIRLKGHPTQDSMWHFLFSDHDDPRIWKLYKEANIKLKSK